MNAEQLLVLAFLGQVALTLAVYLVLGYRRQSAVRSGRMRITDFVVVRHEPQGLARTTRNVSNQFELPVLFYALVLMILTRGGAGPFAVVVAWAFVASRYVHAYVHLRSDRLIRRGLLFVGGYALVALLAIHVLIDVFAG